MEENKKQKQLRYLTTTLAVLGIVAGLATIPKFNTLNKINQEISTTQKKISSEKHAYQKNSPANNSTDFDLFKAKNNAIQALSKAVIICVGGTKNKAEFDDYRPDTEQVLGKKAVNELYKLNGSPEAVVNSPNKFQFILLPKTKAQSTFSPITNIHKTKVSVAFTTFQKATSPETNKEVTVKNNYLLNLSYDLANNKVLSSNLTKFDDPNLGNN